MGRERQHHCILSKARLSLFSGMVLWILYCRQDIWEIKNVGREERNFQLSKKMFAHGDDAIMLTQRLGHLLTPFTMLHLHPKQPFSLFQSKAWYVGMLSVLCPAQRLADCDKSPLGQRYFRTNLWPWFVNWEKKFACCQAEVTRWKRWALVMAERVMLLSTFLSPLCISVACACRSFARLLVQWMGLLL